MFQQVAKLSKMRPKGNFLVPWLETTVVYISPFHLLLKAVVVGILIEFEEAEVISS